MHLLVRPSCSHFSLSPSRKIWNFHKNDVFRLLLSRSSHHLAYLLIFLRLRWCNHALFFRILKDTQNFKWKNTVPNWEFSLIISWTYCFLQVESLENALSRVSFLKSSPKYKSLSFARHPKKSSERSLEILDKRALHSFDFKEKCFRLFNFEYICENDVPILINRSKRSDTGARPDHYIFCVTNKVERPTRDRQLDLITIFQLPNIRRAEANSRTKILTLCSLPKIILTCPFLIYNQQLRTISLHIPGYGSR